MQNIIENTKGTIFLTCACLVLAIISASALSVRADQSLVNVVAGTSPIALAVNSVTNRTYVVNRDSNTVGHQRLGRLGSDG